MPHDENEDLNRKRTRGEVLLELAGQLGNISEACRRMHVDRSAYYRAARRAKEGPRPRSRLAKPPELEEKLVALCLEYPEWGCDRLAYYLTLTGDPLSSPTAQKMLIRNGLGRAAQRHEAARRQGRDAVTAGEASD